MSPHKIVIKCGNFAVLVDLHVLPLGGQEYASWFTTENTEDVTTLIRDAVDQRVKQYVECLHKRGQQKQKRELTPAKPFCLRGRNLNLVANVVKRHFNLRCIVKQQYGELRVFPERYVVCASRPKDASALHGNPSLAATELDEQSRSEYFSRPGETQEPLNSSTITKRTVLQKIVRQANAQPVPCVSTLGEQNSDRTASPSEQGPGSETTPPGQETSETAPLVAMPPGPTSLTEPREKAEGMGEVGLTQEQQGENGLTGCTDPSQTGQSQSHDGGDTVSSQAKHSLETSKSGRRKPSILGEDPPPERAKRVCLGGPPVSSSELITQTHSAESSSQTSKHDPLPPPPLPPVKSKAKAESKAFPAPERTETTLEVELLTPGKQAQRLPLTSNNTEQTNQNRLAASLRSLSVKPASSGSSISSRSTDREEGSENVPRTSRLRRLKRS